MPPACTGFDEADPEEQASLARQDLCHTHLATMLESVTIIIIIMTPSREIHSVECSYPYFSSFLFLCCYSTDTIHIDSCMLDMLLSTSALTVLHGSSMQTLMPVFNH